MNADFEWSDWDTADFLGHSLLKMRMGFFPYLPREGVVIECYIQLYCFACQSAFIGGDPFTKDEEPNEMMSEVIQFATSHGHFGEQLPLVFDDLT
jgi:hypothetical protein